MLECLIKICLIGVNFKLSIKLFWQHCAAGFHLNTQWTRVNQRLIFKTLVQWPIYSMTSIWRSQQSNYRRMVYWMYQEWGWASQDIQSLNGKEVSVAACATPVPLGPCRELLFAREFLFANEWLASHSHPPWRAGVGEPNHLCTLGENSRKWKMESP